MCENAKIMTGVCVNWIALIVSCISLTSTSCSGDQACLPAQYVDGITIRDLPDGAIVHMDTDGLFVNKTLKVWLRDQKTYRRPHSREYLTIFKKDGRLYVVSFGKETYEPKSMDELYHRDRENLTPVYGIVIRSKAEFLSSMDDFDRIFGHVGAKSEQVVLE